MVKYQNLRVSIPQPPPSYSHNFISVSRKNKARRSKAEIAKEQQEKEEKRKFREDNNLPKKGRFKLETIANKKSKSSAATKSSKAKRATPAKPGPRNNLQKLSSSASSTDSHASMSSKSSASPQEDEEAMLEDMFPSQLAEENKELKIIKTKIFSKNNFTKEEEDKLRKEFKCDVPEEQIKQQQLISQSYQQQLQETHELKLQHIKKIANLTTQQFLMQAIKHSTRNVYLKYLEMVTTTKNPHKKGKFFEWKTKDIIDYMKTEEALTTKNNTTITYLVSAYKFLYKIIHFECIPRSDEELLNLAIRARRALLPDIPKQVGSINGERLEQLHSFYDELKSKREQKKKNPLFNDFTKEVEQELRDASTVMFGCALRIFQLRELQAKNFTFPKKGKGYIEIRSKRKLNNNKPITEIKEIHPDYVQAIKEIVERRKKNTKLFFNWKQQNCKFEAAMKKYNFLAASIFYWPSCQSFHQTHVFRHGAAQDAYEEGGIELVMLRTGHESEGVARHYARSEIEKLKEQQKHIKKSLTTMKDESLFEYWNDKKIANLQHLLSLGIYTHNQLAASNYGINNNKNISPKQQQLIEKEMKKAKFPVSEETGEVEDTNHNNENEVENRRRQREDESDSETTSIQDKITRVKPLAVFYNPEWEIPKDYSKHMVLIKRTVKCIITDSQAMYPLRSNSTIPDLVILFFCKNNKSTVEKLYTDSEAMGIDKKYF